MVKPIMLGKIVERRDQVRKGFLSPLSTAFSTFFSKCMSIKGPFLRERGMAYPLIIFYYGDVRSTCQYACCYGSSYLWFERPTGLPGAYQSYDLHHHRVGDRLGSSQYRER